MSVPAPVSYEYVDESCIPKEFFCSICLKPWVVPFETPCEHVYCYSCIYPIANASKSCPMCRADIDVKGLHRVTRVLREQVETFPVYCGYRSKGCVWEGPRGDYQSHQATCPLRGLRDTIPIPPPTTDTAVSLKVVTEYDEYACTQGHSIMGVLHLQAPRMATDGARRKPISVAAVLDRSGSMAGSKLMLLKDTMRFVVSEMGPEDQLALICYDDKVTETLPLMSMDAEGKRAALAAIESVVHGGMTNISGGIQAGIDALRGVFAAGEYNFVEGPPLSNSMQRRSLGPASNSPPPPPPAVVLPDIYKIEISNDYSPMKRDGVMMHRYGITVKSLGAPQGIAKAVVLGAWLGGKDDVMESKQNDGVHFVSIVSSTTLPCVTIRVCFAAGTGIPQSEYIQPLAEIRKDSVQVIDVAVPRRSTPPPPTPLARSDSFVRTKSVNAITSVWLFTDGQANVGIKDPEALSLAARKRMESYKLDASVFTFGFGSDHNRDLLNVLASSTQGMYYFIEGEDTMKSCFADCLGGLVSVVCQQIKLTMQLSEGVNLKRVVTKYKYEIVGRQVSIAMKDLYAEETRDIIFEVDIPACAESVDAGGYSIGTCRLECLNLLAGCLPETVNAPMKVLRPAMVSFESPVNTLVDEQRNRLRVAEALESADRAAKTGDYRQAKTHLTACKEVVEKSKSHTTSYCVGLAQQLQQTEDLVGSESVYKRAGQYALTNMHEEHRAQRCAKATSAPLESPAMYSNASKEVYRTKATKK